MALDVNPRQLIQLIKNGRNPQQLMMEILEDQISNTPMGANLLNLAKQNKTAEIEQIVRNIAQQRGINYDAEFNAFRDALGL